ncbi:LytR/AlgR family response regulator transcription factor [Pedobacter sp. GR22-6]|uniref:LytR/AlgR family response regulator transcription factor n=1 Tax=Pedobacter sp. GR22-6 TaxID=3127957 RepID=UPI00307E24CF
MNKKINCVIIDDDRFAIDTLEDYIKHLPKLQLLKTYTNSIEAASELSVMQTSVLIFLDIDMPHYSGLQLAQKLKDRSFQIIFTTAHSGYAVDAFRVRARHYLLKPIGLGEFVDVVTDVIAHTPDWMIEPYQDAEALFLRTGERNKLTRVLKKDIIYIQGAGNYVDVFLEDLRLSTYMTMLEMEALLERDQRFYRIQKSYIINERHIKKIDGNTIYLLGHKVSMSTNYNEKFINYLNASTLRSSRINSA